MITGCVDRGGLAALAALCVLAAAPAPGSFPLYLEVTDQNIRPEDTNPVVTLRRRYDAVIDRGTSAS